MKGGCQEYKIDRDDSKQSDWQCSCWLHTYTYTRAYAHVHTYTLFFSFSFFLSVRTDGRRRSLPSFSRVLPRHCFAAENDYVYYRHLVSRQRWHVVRSTRVVNVNAMTVCLCVCVCMYFFRFLASLPPRATTVRSPFRGSVPGRTHAARQQASRYARSLESSPPPRRVSCLARVLQSRKNRGLWFRGIGIGSQEVETHMHKREAWAERRRSCVLGSSWFPCCCCCCAAAYLQRGSILFNHTFCAFSREQELILK